MQSDFFNPYCKQADRISDLCGVECTTYELSKLNYSDGCFNFCTNKCPMAKSGKCNPSNTHLYGCYESERWNSSYIYYCPSGLIFVSNAIFNKQEHLEGGFTCGPIIMSNICDLAESDVVIPAELAQTLPVMTTKKVQHLADVIFDLCRQTLSMQSDIDEDENSQKERHNIMYYVLNLCDLSENKDYPIQYEKQLQSMVAAGDKEGARNLLNKLLGHIYFSSGGDYKTIKARIIELVVVLSRATIDSGADVHQIFWLNAKYLNEIEKIDDMERINRLLINVIHRFISCVFDFDNVKHVDIIYKAIDYIKEHFSEKLSLDDVAQHVHLSKSYLSRIFKEELNSTFTSYTNKIRIEKSKEYLLNHDLSLTDIALLTGFDDQSYFTKVFKKATGVSPGRFREQRGKITRRTNDG